MAGSRRGRRHHLVRASAHPRSGRPRREAVFDQDGVAEHYALLQRRARAGDPIAAGPLQDVRGEGLTILAVRSMKGAERLACEDDQAVATGVLDTRVRPRRVVMTRL